MGRTIRGAQPYSRDGGELERISHNRVKARSLERRTERNVYSVNASYGRWTAFGAIKFSKDVAIIRVASPRGTSNLHDRQEASMG